MQQSKGSTRQRPNKKATSPIFEVLLEELRGHSAIVGGVREGSPLEVAEWRPGSDLWLHDEEAQVFAEMEHVTGFHTAGLMPLLDVLFAPVAGFTIKAIGAGRSDVPLWFAAARQSYEFVSGERAVLVMLAHDYSTAASLVYSNPLGAEWLAKMRQSKVEGAKARLDAARKGIGREDELSHLASAVMETLSNPAALTGADGGKPLRHHCWAAIDSEGRVHMDFSELVQANGGRLGTVRNRFLEAVEAQEFGSGVESPRADRGVEYLDPTLGSPSHDESSRSTNREWRRLARWFYGDQPQTWPFPPPKQRGEAPEFEMVVMAREIDQAIAQVEGERLAPDADGRLRAAPDYLMPADVFPRDQARADAILAAANLSPRQLEALTVHAETASLSATSARMGCNEATVSKHLLRAREKLAAAREATDSACLPLLPLELEGQNRIASFMESAVLAAEIQSPIHSDKRGEENTA